MTTNSSHASILALWDVTWHLLRPVVDSIASILKPELVSWLTLTKGMLWKQYYSSAQPRTKYIFHLPLGCHGHHLNTLGLVCCRGSVHMENWAQLFQPRPQKSDRKQSKMSQTSLDQKNHPDELNLLLSPTKTWLQLVVVASCWYVLRKFWR